jgi:excisionase family DNA binding protein
MSLAEQSVEPNRRRYLRCEEAAAMLGISVSTLRHWVCDRKITFVRKGRMVRFRPEDLHRFMNSGVVKAHAGAGAEE